MSAKPVSRRPPHLLTHVHTTPATVHEAQCTTPIQQALVDKDVAPREHLVDAAYISSALLVHSRDEQDILLRGPTRPSQGWQTQVEGAYTLEQFAVDWDQQQVRCPPGLSHKKSFGNLNIMKVTSPY